MDSFKFTLVMIMLLYVSSQVENSKSKECSLRGIEFEQCLNQVQSTDIFGSCCQTLTQAVEAGYSCLCSLLRSSTPIIGITLSLQLSNCYISMPSLTRCQKSPPSLPAAELTPVPAARQLPPEIARERQPQSSTPNDSFRAVSPTRNEIPPSPSPIKNSTISARQPTLNRNTLPESAIPESKQKKCSGGDKSNSILHPRFLLAIAFCLCATM